MALGFFGDDDGDISKTRRKQMREMRRREARSKVSGVVSGVKRRVRRAKNRVRTGTKRGGSGERVPGYVESGQQKRKRVARKVRGAIASAGATAKETGSRQLESAKEYAQEVELGEVPGGQDRDARRVFRAAEETAGMAPVVPGASLDPTSDLGDSMWRFAAAGGGEGGGVVEMATADMDLQDGGVEDEVMLGLDFGEEDQERVGLVFGEEDMEDYGDMMGFEFDEEEWL